VRTTGTGGPTPRWVRLPVTMMAQYPGVQNEKFPLPFDGAEYLGHVSYPLDTTEKRPLIIVCPNYAGLNEFDEAQCAYLASIGYVALAIDFYGEAHPFDLRTNKAKTDPATAAAHRSGAFAAMNAMLSDWAKFRRFLRAWISAGKTHSAACPTRCAAIGYCFGGCAVLEIVRDGIPGVQGVVSFHGVLTSFPQPLPDAPAPAMVSQPSNSFNNPAIKVLIENGADDHLGTGEPIACAHFVGSSRVVRCH
jgi:dienelactone hydrolase